MISACKHESTINKNIKEFIMQNAHNPDSYEPISTTLIDSTTELKNLNSLILQETEKEFGQYQNSGIKEDGFELKELKHQLDSVEKSPNPNSIYCYMFTHQCRIKVPLGGLMLKNMLFTTDSKYNIINFSEQ